MRPFPEVHARRQLLVLSGQSSGCCVSNVFTSLTTPEFKAFVWLLLLSSFAGPHSARGPCTARHREGGEARKDDALMFVMCCAVVARHFDV